MEIADSSFRAIVFDSLQLLSICYKVFSRHSFHNFPTIFRQFHSIFIDFLLHKFITYLLPIFIYSVHWRRLTLNQKRVHSNNLLLEKVCLPFVTRLYCLKVIENVVDGVVDVDVKVVGFADNWNAIWNANKWFKWQDIPRIKKQTCHLSVSILFRPYSFLFSPSLFKYHLGRTNFSSKAQA